MWEFFVYGVLGILFIDIVVVVGVIWGVIYWYFKNKVDLFNEVWELLEFKVDLFELEY